MTDEATEMVKAGSKMVRTEDQTMQSIAELRPRALTTVKGRGLEEIEAFPNEAYRWYYAIPYKDGKGGTTSVEGPSIHLALMVQRYWGNCSSAWIYDTETEDHVWLKGVFIDLETNTRFEKSFRVSKKGKQRGSNQVYELRDDRLTMAINAGGSKAQRNAIIAGVPDPIVTVFLERAKELMRGDKPKATLSGEAVAKIVAAFEPYEVPLDALERSVKKPCDKWTGNTRVKLMGMYNALKEGGAVSEVIGKPAVKQTKGKPKGSPAKIEPPTPWPAPSEEQPVTPGVNVVEPEVVADDEADPFAEPLFGK